VADLLRAPQRREEASSKWGPFGARFSRFSAILAARHPREWGWSVKLGTKTNCSPPGHLLTI